MSPNIGQLHYLIADEENVDTEVESFVLEFLCSKEYLHNALAFYGPDDRTYRDSNFNLPESWTRPPI
jgi:hypothetical protein